MKLIVQVGILFGICWASQWVEQLLPFTMPASIIGMVMLLGLLALGIVRTEHIREKSDFLLGNLPFFFVPATVSMMNYADVLKSNLAALAVICVVSTVVTFAATVCVAVSIYAKMGVLRKNLLPVLAGCAAGTAASVASVFLLCRLFGLEETLTMSLLPKSVTTPIATAIAQSHGGIVAITVAAVIFTGILGNLCAPLLIRLFRVRDPVAAGLGIGACSHAMGTAKALELGETEGAMSGIAIGLCGILTTVLALFFGCLPAA